MENMVIEKMNYFDNYVIDNSDCNMEFLISVNKYLTGLNEYDIATRTRDKFEEEFNMIKEYQFINSAELSIFLSKIISAIWSAQPFCDGNTRTMIILAKMLCNKYEIDFDYKTNINELFREIRLSYDDNYEDLSDILLKCMKVKNGGKYGCKR